MSLYYRYNYGFFSFYRPLVTIPQSSFPQASAVPTATEAPNDTPNTEEIPEGETFLNWGLLWDRLCWHGVNAWNWVLLVLQVGPVPNTSRHASSEERSDALKAFAGLMFIPALVYFAIAFVLEVSIFVIASGLLDGVASAIWNGVRGVANIIIDGVSAIANTFVDGLRCIFCMKKPAQLVSDAVPNISLGMYSFEYPGYFYGTNSTWVVIRRDTTVDELPPGMLNFLREQQQAEKSTARISEHFASSEVNLPSAPPMPNIENAEKFRQGMFYQLTNHSAAYNDENMERASVCTVESEEEIPMAFPANTSQTENKSGRITPPV